MGSCLIQKFIKAFELLRPEPLCVLACRDVLLLAKFMFLHYTNYYHYHYHYDDEDDDDDEHK